MASNSPNHSDHSVCTYFARSEVGNQRKDNQDNYCIIDQGKWVLLVVCDGMGGARGGDIASEIAVNEIIKHFKRERNQAPTSQELKELVQTINLKIFRYGQTNPTKKGLGTTLSLIACDLNGYKIAHVGDSRIYRFREERCEQLTTDHTWAAEVNNAVQKEKLNKNSSPLAHMLTRSLGVQESVEIELSESDDLKKEDFFLLSSDGLHNYCDCNDFKLEEFLGSKKANFKQKDFQKTLVGKLFQHALKEEGADNLTAISLFFLKDKNEFAKKDLQDIVKIGRTLSVEEEFDTFHIEVPAVASYKTNEREQEAYRGRRNGQSSGLFFLYGALFAALIGGFVWLIRPVEVRPIRSPAFSEEMISALSRVQIGQHPKESIARALKPYSIELEDFYSRLHAKANQVLDPQLKSPPYREGESKVQENEAPNRPIVWENEEIRLELIRKFESVNQNERKENLGKELGSEPASRAYLYSEKKLIREELYDLTEKLRQLNLLTEKDAKQYLSELLELERQIAADQERLASFEEEVLKKKTGIFELKRLSNDNNPKAQEGLAEKLVADDPTLEALLKRIKLLRETQDYYSDLVTKVSQPEAIVLKLTSNQRELKSLYQDLQTDIERSLKRIENEFFAYVAAVEHLKDLLRLERSRIQKAIGYAEAFVPLSEERRNAMFNKTSQNHQKLFKQYQAFEEEISAQMESQRETRLNFEELKSN